MTSFPFSACFATLFAIVAAAPVMAAAGPNDVRMKSGQRPQVGMNPAWDGSTEAMRNERRANIAREAARRGFQHIRRSKNDDDRVLMDFDGDRPIYYSTRNANAAVSINAYLPNTAKTQWEQPYGLTGSGVSIGIIDDGFVYTDHEALTGRVTKVGWPGENTASITSSHPSLCAGTMVGLKPGTDINYKCRGMASGAQLYSYSWNNANAKIDSFAARYAGDPGKIYVSNHSYGPKAGWAWDGLRSHYYWETPTALDKNNNMYTPAPQDPLFGNYIVNCMDLDAIAYTTPYNLQFYAVGNDNTDGPATAGVQVDFTPHPQSATPGTPVYKNWDPASMPLADFNYKGRFDTIVGEALSKNVMAVGSVNDAVSGSGADVTRDLTKAAITGLSSQGPTDDGRIKPDVVTNGETITSSDKNGASGYFTTTGTSFAAPSAVGAGALLIQKYGQHFPGQYMRAATLKALMIHTADDLGNAGPDYTFGWGLVNVRAAADLIQAHADAPARRCLTESKLTPSALSRTIQVRSDGSTPLKVTLCWFDPPGKSTVSSGTDVRISRLVNDLNLKVTGPDGVAVLPWVMPFTSAWTVASMSQPATRGTNHTDTIEQVIIPAPAAGVYTIQVSCDQDLLGYSRVASAYTAASAQDYSLVVSGSTAVAAPALPAFELQSVTPPAATASAAVTLDLAGYGLTATTAVTLRRTGFSPVSPTSRTMNGPVLRCVFNLTNVSAGDWDVVTDNNSGLVSTLSAGFRLVNRIAGENFDAFADTTAVKNAGWATSGPLSSNPTHSSNWQLKTDKAQTAAKSMKVQPYAATGRSILTSPAFMVPADTGALEFSFYHWYDLDFSTTLNTADDGGRLELSIDNGTTWFGVDDSGSGVEFSAGGYNTSVASSISGHPFAGKSVWSKNSGAWVQTVVKATNPARFAGRKVKLRWVLGSNSSNSNTYSAIDSWWVDSLVVSSDRPLDAVRPVSLASVYPNRGAAGSAVTVELSATGLTSDTTFKLVRSGQADVPAAQISINEGRLRGTFDLTNAAAGTWSLTATGADGSTSTLADVFTVFSPTFDPAGISMISPVSGTADGRAAIQITGTGFIPGSIAYLAKSSGEYHRAYKTVWNSGSSITAYFDLMETAAGIWNVELDPPASTSTSTAETLYLVDSFTVNPSSGVAVTLTGVSPNSANRNTTATVTLAGAGFAAGTTVKLTRNGQADLSATSVSIGSPTSLLATFDFTGVAPGPWSITATLPGGAGSAMLSNAFLVNSNLAIPGIAAISPASGESGEVIPLIVTGADFSSGTTVKLSRSGQPDLPATAVVPVNSTTLQAVFNLNGVPAGAWTVSVANAAGESSQLVNAFAVNPPLVFTSWQGLHFTPVEIANGDANPTGDRDGDGLPNLVEYALGRDPKARDSAAVIHRDATGLWLTHTRPQGGRPDIDYFAESSENMTQWQPVLLETAVAGNPETIRLRDPLVTGDTARRFLRLRVQLK